MIEGPSRPAPDSAAAVVVIGGASPEERSALRHGVEQHGGCVVAETGDRTTTVAASLRARPQLLIVTTRVLNDVASDVAMLHATTGTPVVVLTPEPGPDELLAALGGGARAYLPTTTTAASLARALRAVLSGEVAAPRALVRDLVAALRTGSTSGCAARNGSNPLTDREQEVVSLLAEGATTHEVATALYVSPTTVRTHLASAMRKLRVPYRDARLHAVAAPPS